MKTLLYIFLGLSLMFGCSDDSDSDSNESDTVDPVNECTVSSTFSSVTIGDQIWTNSNLDISTYCDGTLIPQFIGNNTDNQEWRNLTTGAWTYTQNCDCGAGYNFSEAELHSFGKLYNWYAVAGIHDNDDLTPNKKFAPDNWRIPTTNDYQLLFSNNSVASLRATGNVENGDGLWFSQVDVVTATNETGFSIIPAGARGPNPTGANNDGYVNLGYFSYYWTSNSGDGIENAWLVVTSGIESPNDFGIYHGGNEEYNWTSDYSRRNAFSVRLVKDLE